jgi:hypothetical protein
MSELCERLMALAETLGLCELENPIRSAGDVVQAVSNLRRMELRIAELEQAIARGNLDIEPCMLCGMPVVCVPDGTPICTPCAMKGDV